jgi:hypothetical protein
MLLMRLLDESRAFGPKATAVLLEAFTAVIAELDLRSNADKERAAKIIIRLALGQKDLDATKLRGGPDEKFLKGWADRRVSPRATLLYALP